MDLTASRDWDDSYLAGDWDYFRSIEQLPRYGIMAAYVLRFCRGGRLLDLGCGEGVLRELIPDTVFSEYVGADFSSVAIERARARNFLRSTFACADIGLFSPPASSYEVIYLQRSAQCCPIPIRAAAAVPQLPGA